MTSEPAVSFLRDRWLDLVIAGAVFLLGVTLGDSFLGMPWGVLVSLAFSAPLVWRRTHPDQAALALVVPHVLQLVSMPSPGVLNVSVPIMLFAVAAYGQERWTRPWLVVGLGAAVLAGLRWGTATASWLTFVSFTGTCAAIVAAAWFMGALQRQRRAREQADRDRIVAQEREQAQAVRLAATQERQRIAREMHDVVAHSLSVIVVQADGARYVLTETPGDAQQRLEAAGRAVATIRDTAAAALTETRRLVGVLHDEEDLDQADRAPAASLADLPTLVRNLTDAGRVATLEMVGSPDSHAPLGPVGELAAYRLVQEALTNVLKHAGPAASVRVVLDHVPGAGVSVTVRDDGVGAGATDGQGHGHHGMRARVAALGGSLTLSNHPEGGFEVRAFLPADPERHP